MSKVSFTIRRPTPVSRASSEADSDSSSFKIPSLPRRLANDSSTPGSPLARSATGSPVQYVDGDSSSEEDDVIQDELVTGFDKFGVQRLNQPRKQPQGPLVIPALQNRDWRDVARKRKSANQFAPTSAQASTGADGSVGGLGTKDTINSGPVLSGLQMRKKVAKVESDNREVQAVKEDATMEVGQETDDQKALRAILASAEGQEEGTAVDIIPVPVSEADAYKQDVDELPESSTLEDYERVPVAQFGAALLRGMGWKEGTAASRKAGKGMVEPYLPEARPALLGIGAKEREALDDGSKSRRPSRPERRYVPVVRRDRDGNIVSESSERDRRRSDSPRRNGSSAPSRRSSRSPSRRSESRRYDRDYDYGRSRDRDRDRDRDRRESRRHRSRDSDRRQ